MPGAEGKGTVTSFAKLVAVHLTADTRITPFLLTPQ